MSKQKFEGPRYVEYFWNLGEADEVRENGEIVFEINLKDCERWPVVFDVGDLLILWKDDDGVVQYRIEPESDGSFTGLLN